MKQFLQLIRPFREMRKIAALCLVMLLTLGAAWAQTTVTFTAGTDTGETSVTKDGVTVTMSTMSRTDNYRCYANTDMSVTSNVGNITSVELTCTGNGNANYGPGKFSLTTGYTGTYSYSAYVGTWTGSAEEISLSASAQVRMTEIVVTVGGSAPTTFTVTYNANGGTGTMVDENSPYDAGAMVTVMDNEFTRDDYVFENWNTSSDGLGTDYDEGDQFEINANTTLYAQWVEQSSDDVHWVLTDLASLTSEDVFVIVGDNGSKFAMKNDNGTSSAPATVAVTVSGNEITGAVAPNIRWNVSGNATDGYTFYPNGSTSTWLYCNTTAGSSSNNNMRVGTGDRKVFEMNSSNFLMTKDDYVVRYLSIYNDQDWRGYINTDLCPEISFYKKYTGEVLPPSITAEDVSIEYNAISGAVEYTINNGVEGGTLVAATESDWLTLGTVGETVPFTCTANTEGTPRTAVVTLTYTYGDNQTATANVTVSQAGNPNVVDNISDITAAGTYAVQGTIVAKSQRGFIVGDGTGYVYYYNQNYTQNDYNIGDIVKLSGSVVAYGGVYEFNNSTTITSAETSNYVTEGPIVLTGADMDARVASNETSLSTYVQYQGTLTVSGNYYNITNIDGATTAKGSISSPLNTDFASLDGSVVVVDGYFVGVSSSQYYNTMIGSITEVVSEEPVITVADATVNAPCTATEGILAVTYDNLTITDMADFDIQYYDAAGIEVQEPEWIEVVVAEQDPEVGEGYVVSYTIEENESEARTAYFKVYALDDNAEYVYSNLVTINQAQYVADYATLPFAFNGGRADIETTAGLTHEGLGTDYGVSNNPTTLLKFDGTGDWLILHFNEAPGTLSFDIKGNSFSGGTFTVQTSEDGEDYATLAIYTELGATQTEAFPVLGSSVRYIKWIYTTKSSGNVGLGNIVLDKPCDGIVLNAEHPMEFINFEDVTESTEPYTGVTPRCWTWTNLVTAEVPGHPVVSNDTATHVYYNSAYAHSGNYSLRSYFRGITAMPELVLDEGVDMRSVKMSFWYRQPHWFYPMQVGVMTDPADASTFVPVAYVNNGNSTAVTKFELDFSNYTGEGRYIAFKHFVPDATSLDIHGVNYIDDITLELIEPVTECPTVALGETIDFEGITTLVNGATGVSPRCWEVVSGTPAVVPQLYHKAAYAHESNYSLRMVDRCVYAMPELAEGVAMNGVKMELYVRQPNAVYQLEVGVWDGTAFVPVALINNSDAEVTKVTVDFTKYPSEVGRIAFRNTLQQGVDYPYSYNYLDDITLTAVEPVDCSAGMSWPYSENFDNYTSSALAATGIEPDCWEVVDGTPAVSPQLYCKAAYAHSSSYSLRMSDRCVYAMPELPSTVTSFAGLGMTMYVRQANVVYQLEVGVWDATSGTFTRIATINNTDDAVTPVTVDLSSYSGTGRRIAFRNTLQQGVDYPYSYNYIDDIEITTSKNAIASDGNVMYGDEMESERYLDNIAVYPNPTTGVLHIDAVDVEKVECYSQMGQLVGVYDNVNELNISELSNGVYMLRITVPQGVTMRKVVKK